MFLIYSLARDYMRERAFGPMAPDHNALDHGATMARGKQLRLACIRLWLVKVGPTLDVTFGDVSVVQPHDRHVADFLALAAVLLTDAAA